jgi:hypothetical protein
VIRVAAVAFVLALGACGDGGTGPGDDDGTGDPDGGAGGGGDAAVDACESGGIPAGGVCRDGDVARCVGGDRVETEDCGAGSCVALGDVAMCLSVEACAGVGPLGRCDGDVLWRCDDGPALSDCAAAGPVCGYTDDAAGYACVDSSTAGSFVVRGTVRWEDRPLSPGELGAPTPVPGRGVMVAVLDDATDMTLTTASASDDGSFTLRYTAAANAQVRVTAYSRSRATARPARVRDASGYLHAFGSPAFTAGAAAPVDLLVTAANNAAAWNALDNMVRGMDLVRAHGVTSISPLIVYWQLGSATGSYYQGGNNELHLDGDDGYDDVVALHEFGHYMQDEYSASDNPGGAHDGSPADPRLAWGEGGATWFAIAARGVPYYIDYAAGGGWSVELEDRVHAATLTSGMSQNISEWMVAEVMWDVSDGALDGDGDPVAMGGRAEVFEVLLGYLVDPTASDRGRTGVDLVDWLDGWFMHHGMASCAGMRTLLRERYRFPYDFAGPAGSCP